MILFCFFFPFSSFLFFCFKWKICWNFRIKDDDKPAKMEMKNFSLIHLNLKYFSLINRKTNEMKFLEKEMKMKIKKQKFMQTQC